MEAAANRLGQTTISQAGAKKAAGEAEKLGALKERIGGEAAKAVEPTKPARAPEQEQARKDILSREKLTDYATGMREEGGALLLGNPASARMARLAGLNVTPMMGGYHGRIAGETKEGYLAKAEAHIDKLAAKEGENRAAMAQNKTQNETVRAGRHYLQVPYAEKDKAKAAGARWDAEKKSWYHPDPANMPASLSKYSASQSTRPASQAIAAAAPKTLEQMATPQEVTQHIAELKQRRKNYQALMNEGGGGFNPFDERIRAAEERHQKLSGM